MWDLWGGDGASQYLRRDLEISRSDVHLKGAARCHTTCTGDCGQDDGASLPIHLSFCKPSVVFTVVNAVSDGGPGWGVPKSSNSLWVVIENKQFNERHLRLS